MTSTPPMRPSYEPDSRQFALVLTDVPEDAIASVHEVLGPETTKVYPAIVARRLTSQDAEAAAAQLRALGALVEIWDETPPVSEGVSMPSDPEPVSLSPQLPDTYVIIIRAGDKKIQVIKEVRSATSMGLKEAKDLVDATPSVLGPFQTREAIEAHGKLQTAGAKCEVVGPSESTDAQVYDVVLLQPPVKEKGAWPAALRRLAKTCPSGTFSEESTTIVSRVSGYLAEQLIQMVAAVGGSAMARPTGQVDE